MQHTVHVGLNCELSGSVKNLKYSMIDDETQSCRPTNDVILCYIDTRIL